MASFRDIRRRIISVQNTEKITKAMEMVAAARLRRAQQRIEAARPYADNMLEFIGQLVRYIPVAGNEYPLLKEHATVKRVAVIALTADRGLAGAFNSNIMRRAFDRVDTYAAQGVESDLVIVGRKGYSTARFQGYRVDKAYLDVTDRTALPRPSQPAPSSATRLRPSTGCTWCTTTSKAPWNSMWTSRSSCPSSKS